MSEVFNNYAPGLLGPKTTITSSGGSGGGGQVATYVSDPTSEAIVPTDPTQPCVAYKADGTGALYNWVVATQSWV